MQKFLSDLIQVFVLAVLAGSVAARAQYGPLVQPVGNQPPQNNSYNLSPGTVNQVGSGTKHSVPGSTSPGATTQGNTSRGQTGTNGWNRVNNVSSGSTTQGSGGRTQAGSGWNQTRNAGTGTTSRTGATSQGNGNQTQANRPGWDVQTNKGSGNQTQASTSGWDVKTNKAAVVQSPTQGSARNQALVQQGSTTRGQTVGGTARSQSNLISGSRSMGQTQTGSGLTRPQNTNVQSQTRHLTAAPPHRNH